MPPLPDDVPTLRNYSIHGSGNNSLTRVTISASGITHDVETLVYDDLPADLIISLNYPSFTKLWNEVEQQKVGINAVFTHQQAQHEIEEESSAEVTNESKSTPLSEILGDAYDFPQTNLSVKQLLPELPSNLPAFTEAQKQDVTLKLLWLQADKILNMLLKRVHYTDSPRTSLETKPLS